MVTVAGMLNREQMRYCGNMGIQGNLGMEKRNKDPNPRSLDIRKKFVLACMKSARL